MTRKDFMYVQITLSIWPIEGADTMDRASPGSNTDPAHETAAAISKLLDVPLADLMNVRFRSPKGLHFRFLSCICSFSGQERPLSKPGSPSGTGSATEQT